MPLRRSDKAPQDHSPRDMSRLAQRREAFSGRTAPVSRLREADQQETPAARATRVTPQAHEQCTGDGVDESRVQLLQSTWSKAIKLQAGAEGIHAKLEPRSNMSCTTVCSLLCHTTCCLHCICASCPP
eukprot:3696335-Amphidinium_carterae.1